jgi:hypothetical protein
MLESNSLTPLMQQAKWLRLTNRQAQAVEDVMLKVALSSERGQKIKVRPTPLYLKQSTQPIEISLLWLEKG